MGKAATTMRLVVVDTDDGAADDADAVVAEDAVRPADSERHAAARLEAMSRLAGAVAHDLNNLLTAISGTTQWVAATAGAHPERVDEGLETIDQATESAAALVRRLRGLGPRGAGPELVDLAAVVAGVERTMTDALAGRLTLALPPAPCWLVADRGQLEQALVTLAVLARGGALAISVRTTDGGPALAVTTDGALDAAQVRLATAGLSATVDVTAAPPPTSFTIGLPAARATR